MFALQNLHINLNRYLFFPHLHVKLLGLRKRLVIFPGPQSHKLWCGTRVFPSKDTVSGILFCFFFFFNSPEQFSRVSTLKLLPEPLSQQLTTSQDPSALDQGLLSESESQSWYIAEPFRVFQLRRSGRWLENLHFFLFWNNFNSFVKIDFTYIKIQPFSVYNSMIFNNLIYLYKHHHDWVLEHFHHSRKIFCVYLLLFSIPTP